MMAHAASRDDVPSSAIIHDHRASNGVVFAKLFNDEKLCLLFRFKSIVEGKSIKSSPRSIIKMDFEEDDDDVDDGVIL